MGTSASGAGVRAGGGEGPPRAAGRGEKPGPSARNRVPGRAFGSDLAPPRPSRRALG